MLRDGPRPPSAPSAPRRRTWTWTFSRSTASSRSRRSTPGAWMPGLRCCPWARRGSRSTRSERHPVVLVIPAEHRLAGRETVAVADLAGEPLITWPRDPAPAAYDDLVRACHTAGFAPNIVQEVRHAESLLGFVSPRASAWRRCTRRALQPGYPGVAYARLVEPDLTIETGVVWRRGDALARAGSFPRSRRLRARSRVGEEVKRGALRTRRGAQARLSGSSGGAPHRRPAPYERGDRARCSALRRRGRRTEGA